ncbi:methyltransferase domain-containing protein [Trinickia dinghuensis]|uniref:Thiopurine S-methyltransferase n=1 Tax=Trinickia dinghuensis TaxID=2291023 RepID=A0A3D8K4N4_9BURK|nr:methyltransferase domain-containing protein [Trinickia dinghuensis]RDU99835.1 thiopurine S-methyltransferase [Trinickia dinghuensis]
MNKPSSSDQPPPSQPVAGGAAPAFSTRDPNTAAFWDERFRQGFMPWDQAGVPEAFAAFAARTAPRPVLIPGCGSAHEAGWLAQAGWTVRAIDFSVDAVAAARAQLGPHAPLVEQADFFAYRPPFVPGWIYERAFLCALPHGRRADYAAQMAALLEPGGLLAGFFFFDEAPKGPPFGISRDELDALLSPSFELVEDEPVADSIPVFAGRERWMSWRRRG